MGAKFKIKLSHIRIQDKTFDHVLRADGKLCDHILLGILLVTTIY